MQQPDIKISRTHFLNGDCYVCGKALVNDEHIATVSHTKVHEVRMHLTCAVRKLLAGDWAEGIE